MERGKQGAPTQTPRSGNMQAQQRAGIPQSLSAAQHARLQQQFRGMMRPGNPSVLQRRNNVRGTQMQPIAAPNAGHNMPHNPHAMSPMQPRSTAVTTARTKNEDAVAELCERIPEIRNIFDVHTRIGNGTFSTVLLGTLKKEHNFPDHLRRKFAIKHHIPTSHPDRILKELQCMAKMGGVSNVVGINCCIRCNESVAFVMPYMPHDRFHDFFNRMDIREIQGYMKNLLIALRHVHKFDVIHRDVKPSNFLYNRRKREFLLVDFGLAQQVPTPVMHHFAALANLNRSSSTLSTSASNTTAPPPPPVRAEGGAVTETGQKRFREAELHQEGGLSAKRLRMVGSGAQGDVQSAEVEVKVTAAPVDNAGSGGPSGTGSNNNNNQFKMPLKQLNGVNSKIGIFSNSVPNNETTTQAVRQTVQKPGGQPAAVPEPVINKYNTNRNTINNNNVASVPKCLCYGQPQVCNVCLVKKEIHASRAGTPGYRPPEVLLKYPDQTCAVDVWAAGVIFLSILSSVYPFFKAPNDYVALAEMVTIFGDKEIRRTAFELDRLVTLNQKTRPLDLRKLCVRFRNRSKYSSNHLLRKYQNSDGSCDVCKNCDQFFFNCLCIDSPFKTEEIEKDDIFPASAYDLLYKLLEVNPHKRITAEEALNHPFFKEH